jgi:hypothetical protein
MTGNWTDLTCFIFVSARIVVYTVPNMLMDDIKNVRANLYDPDPISD